MQKDEYKQNYVTLSKNQYCSAKKQKKEDNMKYKQQKISLMLQWDVMMVPWIYMFTNYLK